MEKRGLTASSSQTLWVVAPWGDTIEEAMLNAEDALRDYVVEMEKDGHEIVAPSPLDSVEVPPGNQLVSIPLVQPSGARP